MKPIIYIIVVAFSIQSFARGGGDFKVLDELNLTSDQVEKVELFKKDQKEKRKAKKGKRKEHKEQREKMKQLFLSGASDKDLRGQHKNISSKRSRHGEAKLEKMIFLKNLLSKEQRKVYIEKGESRREESRKNCSRKGHRKD